MDEQGLSKTAYTTLLQSLRNKKKWSFLFLLLFFFFKVDNDAAINLCWQRWDSNPHPRREWCFKTISCVRLFINIFSSIAFSFLFFFCLPSFLLCSLFFPSLLFCRCSFSSFIFVFISFAFISRHRFTACFIFFVLFYSTWMNESPLH